MDWGGADLGRGEGVHETLAPASAVHLRPPTPRGLQVGPAEVPMRTGLDPGLPATSSPSSFLPSLSFPGQGQRPSYPLAGEVGNGGGGASVQVPGPRSRPGAFPGQGPWFTVLGQRSRDAGAPSQQAFMHLPVARRPSPRSQAVILSFTLPPTSVPRSTLRSHTSCCPCPGAQQPLAHPWTAPGLPCPHPLHPPHPRRQ